jgi:hypothetical protein
VRKEIRVLITAASGFVLWPDGTDAVLVDANDRYVISPHPPGPFVADATGVPTLYREKSRPLQKDAIHD